MENNSENFEKAIREKYEGYDSSGSDDLWDKLSSRMDNKKKAKSMHLFYRKSFYAIAASVLLLLVFGFLFLKIFVLSGNTKETVQVPSVKSNNVTALKEDTLSRHIKDQRIASQKEIISTETVERNRETPEDSHEPLLKFVAFDYKTERALPDSSKVFLNRNSSLTYISRKKIELMGEGYFDVAHDPSHPFIIAAGMARIKVLGTAFNIHQNDAGMVQVFVERGKVLLYFQDAPEKGVVLLPGETGQLSPGGSVTKYNEINKNILAWKEEKLVFDNMKMVEVATTLSAYFHTEVFLQNEADKNCPFSGSFKKPELQKILKIIASTFSMNYEKSDNKYILQGNGCK